MDIALDIALDMASPFISNRPADSAGGSLEE
jgi:hypothetical protein